MADPVDRQLSGRYAIALFVVVIVLGTVLAAGLLAEPEQFREDVKSWGAAGVGLTAGLALAHAVLPYPAELLCLAAGFAYGFVPGLALMLVVWTASCLLAYWLARRFGRPLVQRFVDQAALARAEERVAGASATTLLALRVIPIVPYNVVSYPSGMFRVPLGRFTWTSTLGLAPQLALVTYFGSEAEELSPADWRIWAVGYGWLALIVLGRRLARRLEAAR